MKQTLIVFAAFLIGATAAQAAPIKAKYCVAVAAQEQIQESTLKDLVAQFASAHGLKKLSHQAANTDAYRSDDSTVEVAVTTKVEGMGAVLFMFDTNKPVGPTAGQLSAYVNQKVAPVAAVTKCSDVPGFKTPTVG